MESSILTFVKFPFEPQVIFVVFPESKVVVKLISGSHSQEDAVNSMINDEAKYSNIVNQLEARGML